MLIDASGGTGRGIDASTYDLVYAFVCALRAAYPHLGINVAVGLSAQTLPSIERLLRDVLDIGIDAEGRLRDADDRLMIDAAVEYVAKAHEMMTLT